MPDEDVNLFKKRFPKFKEKGEVHNEFLMKHKSGRLINIEFDVKIRYDKDGNFKQTHCILKDVTEKKHQEEEEKQNLIVTVTKKTKT